MLSGKGISTAACWTETLIYRLMTTHSAVSANGITRTKDSGLPAMMPTGNWKGRTGWYIFPGAWRWKRAKGSLHDEELHLSAMEDASREVIENIDDLLVSISY